MDLCRCRASCRSYRPDPVPREYLDRMVEAARQAPSACNRQPWRFAVVTGSATRGRLAREGLLPGLSAAWVAEAPALIALGMQRDLATHRLAPLISGVDYPWIDLGIAGEHLVLQATELGLGTCWVGWIRAGKVRSLVGWPRRVRPVALVTVGWPREGASFRTTDRKPASEIATWIE